MTKRKITGRLVHRCARHDHEARNAEIAALKAELAEQHPGAGRFTASYDEAAHALIWTYVV